MYSLPLLYSGRCVATLRETFLVRLSMRRTFLLNYCCFIKEAKNEKNFVCFCINARCDVCAYCMQFTSNHPYQ